VLLRSVVLLRAGQPGGEIGEVEAAPCGFVAFGIRDLDREAVR
jgi:hypothetical protein